MIVLQGMLLGIAIAAPVGPISLLCMQRSLAAGFGAGVRFGLGIALADGLFAVAGALGATALATLFGTLQPWLQRLAAFYLGYLAWRTCMPRERRRLTRYRRLAVTGRSPRDSR